MDNLIRKKIILCLLDCATKSANEIADEIEESLATVGNQVTTLISDSICEKASQGEISQYVVRKDVETFARLVKEFLSNKEEHKQQIEQFITSEYYLIGIDDELVNYILNRFYLNSVYQTDETREGIRKILIGSPSALFFALHGDTAAFKESWSHWNQLSSLDENRDQLTRMLRSGFEAPLLEGIIADMREGNYISLYDKLQIRLAKISIHVSLATPHEKYVEAIGERIFGFRKAAEELAEDLRPGQLITYVNPIDFSDDGLAFLNLGDFQAALDSFDRAFSGVQDSTQKAIVLNNKGLAFLAFKQYQEAIKYFEQGIASDVEGKFPELRDNKQLAEEYLAQASDADNLTEPTQVRFIQGLPIPFEETRFYEFKEIKAKNPVGSTTNDADESVVAFLNREGGRIFWGVRDSDRSTVGVILDEQQRDEVRRKVSEKLGSIRPPISVEDWHLELHQVYGAQGEIVENLWVIELLVLSPQRREVFYTNKGELHVKTEGGKKKLSGPEITEFIRRHFQNDTETN